MAAVFIGFGAGLVAVAPGQTPVPQQPVEPLPLYDFYARGPYRAEIPRPSSILGYEPGEFLTTFGAFEKLLAAYEGKSDRLKVMFNGQSEEHRKFYRLIISDPSNLARLDEIKRNIAALADPRAKLAPAEVDRLCKETPVIVWLNYSMHGDESASFEDGVQVLFQLLASEDAKLADALKAAVVVLAPAHNPDGHEKFTTWYNGFNMARPEPFAAEHEQPWSIRGRLNRNFFDLNRDFVSASQTETRRFLESLLEWKPQVVADHHGQPGGYYFPPVALPVNPALPRQQFDHWMTVMGKGNAAAFDRQGWLHYSREVFDAFYPGYADTATSLHGAAGMTYETDGGGKKGHRWLREDGSVITQRESIAKHFVASLATLETAAANRESLLRGFSQFFQTALEAPAAGGPRQVVLPLGSDPGRAGELAGVLLAHGIEVRRVTEKFSLAAARLYADGPGTAAASREVAPDALVIDLAQPRGRMARALLAPDQALDADFLADQQAKRERNRQRGEEARLESYEFYDVTAWSLPLGFGLTDACWSETPAPVSGDLLLSASSTGLTTRGADGTEKRTEFSGAVPEMKPGETPAAWIFTPEMDNGYRMAIRLLKEGYRLGACSRELQANGKIFPQGTFVVRTERNPATVHGRVRALAAELGVPVEAVASAFIETRGSGIGSEEVFSLVPPQVAVAAGDGIDHESYGHLVFSLNQKYGLDLVPVRIGRLSGANLAGFNVVILPDGETEAYTKAFGADGATELKAWCERGGTLICMGGAVAWAGKEAKLIDLKEIGPEEESSSSEEKKDGKGAADEKKPKEEKSADETEKWVLPLAGAAVRAEMNRTNFLAFGYPAEQTTLAALVQGETFYQPDVKANTVLSLPKSGPFRLAGFVWPGNTERLLAGAALVQEKTLGDGRLILTHDGPAFRQFWRTQEKMFLNAVLFSPAMKGPDDGSY